MTITPEKRRENQRENQNYFSGKISELTRYIGFGLVAAAFSLLSRATEFAETLSASNDTLLIKVAICGCIVVLLDYFQMLFGYIAASKAANNDQQDYKPTPLGKTFSAAQSACFVVKQVFAIFGVILLLIAITRAITLT